MLYHGIFIKVILLLLWELHASFSCCWNDLFKKGTPVMVVNKELPKGIREESTNEESVKKMARDPGME